MDEEKELVEYEAKLDNFNFKSQLTITINLPEDALIADVNSAQTKIIASAQAICNDLFVSSGSNS